MRCLCRLVSFFFIFTLCAACRPEPDSLTRARFLTETRFFLDTECTVTLYEPKDQTLLDLSFAKAHDLEKILSRTYPGSDIDRINRSEGRPVEVSDNTLAVLQAGIAYGKLSDGLFDITIAPALSLWDFKSSSPSLPDSGKLEASLPHVDYRMIDIHKNTVTLPAGMALDLGALAKGYIADEMAAILRNGGASSALVDLGGDVVAIGSKPGGKPFKIGIQTPFASTGQTSKTIEVSNQAIATSGIYERSFILEDTIYHHILDPSTGYPAENDIASATILADTAMRSDALTTISILRGGSLPDISAESGSIRHITISRSGAIWDSQTDPP